MEDFPLINVNSKKKFYACGIDYGRSINIFKYRDRGPKIIKCYIVLFVCFTTKALYLDLVK